MSFSIVMCPGLKPVIRRINELQTTRIDCIGGRQCQDKVNAAQLYPLHTQNNRMKVENLRLNLATKLY
jgi:hypothetical protein